MENEAITLEELKQFIGRLNGKSSEGINKVVMQYELFQLAEDKINKIQVSPQYFAENLEVYIRRDTSPANAGWYSIDIVGQREDDLELNLLWQTLETLGAKEAEDVTQNYIFHLALIERLAIYDEKDAPPILFADLVNPLYWARIKNGEGRDTVRMLVPMEHLTFRLASQNSDEIVAGKTDGALSMKEL